MFNYAQLCVLTIYLDAFIAAKGGNNLQLTFKPGDYVFFWNL